MPNRKKSVKISRKSTPWDSDPQRTPLQKLIRDQHLDETFYPLRKKDIKLNEYGTMLRWLLYNQICIGTACTEKEVLCFYECNWTPSNDIFYNFFTNHIERWSILIHDAAEVHNKLIDKLSLVDKQFKANDCKKLSNYENPLYRINNIHSFLKRFFSMHISFNRTDIQGCLNLFSFIMNPPDDKVAKIEIILDRAFSTKKRLKYRELFSKKQKSDS